MLRNGMGVTLTGCPAKQDEILVAHALHRVGLIQLSIEAAARLAFSRFASKAQHVVDSVTSQRHFLRKLLATLEVMGNFGLGTTSGAGHRVTRRGHQEHGDDGAYGA